jgi:hypothetical protein
MRLADLKKEIKRNESMKLSDQDVAEFVSIANASIENAEGLALKNLFNRFGISVSVSKDRAKIKVSP